MDEGGYREQGPEPRVFESFATVDSLRHDGARLVVFSPEPMHEWKVGQYRKTAIHFRGERYAVVVARPVVGGHEYVLEPWALRPNELSSQEIVYDETYVRERQESARELRERRRQFWMLVPVWPALGFLPRSIKVDLRDRFGFEFVRGTQRSVLLELVAIVLLSGFLIGGVEALTWVLIPLIIDFVLRCSILFEDSYPPYGFWEWLVHPDLKEMLWATYGKYQERRKRLSSGSRDETKK